MFEFATRKKFWGNLLLVAGLAIFQLLAAGSAQALLIGAMDRTATNVKLCLDDDCPLVDNHPFHPGRRIVVYETKGKWARVSRYIERDKAGINYPGFFLPEKVAMWIPVAELPAALSEQILGMSVEEFQKQEAAKAKRRKFSYIPRKPGMPRTDPRGPERIFEVAAAPDATLTSDGTVEPSGSAVEKVAAEPKPENDIPLAEAEEIDVVESDESKAERKAQMEKIKQEIAKAEAAAKNTKTADDVIEEVEVVEVAEAETIPEEKEVRLEPIDAQASGPKSAISNVPNMSPRTIAKLASVKASEPEKVAVVAEPEIKIPKKLTKRLRDKRLSALPSKPEIGLDQKSMIAIRYHALSMLENNECSSIETGGPSLSLKGWIYIKCGGDPFLHQYEVE